jgi:hypothetical protein
MFLSVPKEGMGDKEEEDEETAGEGCSCCCCGDGVGNCAGDGCLEEDKSENDDEFSDDASKPHCGDSSVASVAHIAGVVERAATECTPPPAAASAGDPNMAAPPDDDAGCGSV